MNEALTAIILNILVHQNIMTLATIRRDGFPQATNVYYVNDGLILYFATDPVSQKAGNIQINNKVAVSITADAKNANKLKAVSLSGMAKKVADPTRAHEMKTKLFQAVPDAKRFAPHNANELIVYAITPVAISLVDYAAGYGKTFLVEL